MADIPSAGAITLRLMSMEVARRACDRQVSPEHLLVAICELSERDDAALAQDAARLELAPSSLERLGWERRILKKALKEAGADPDRLARRMLARIGRGPDVGRETRTYHRNEACREVYRVSDRLSRACGALSVEPLHVLWALVTTEFNAVGSFLEEQGLDLMHLSELCERLSQQTFTPKELATRSQRTTRSTTPFLDKVGKDLTDLARRGELPKLVGMEKPVLQLCQGLLRMDKGAVLLLGEPGVGKTAAVEAFAQSIADGTLPGVLGQRLGECRVVEVPLASLVAGTGLRGQFEERIQTLLDEARQNIDSVILFMDEIHLMMGAGATQNGGMDVGNLFKPAMSRGELRLIGATTPDECARHLEKDAAIMRRWERVHVEEAPPEHTRHILRELRPALNEHYRLVISDGALEAAVDFAQRYIHDRRQPARSLDVLHEACAHMMCLHHAEEHWRDPTYTSPAPQRLVLTRGVVAEIVAQKCKLPAARVLAHDDRLGASVRAALEARVFGQSEAIDAVMSVISRAAQGLTDPERPDGAFVLLGPSGTGKSELARTVAKAMFGERQERFIAIDMAEFTDQGQISRLLGAAPGFAGFEQGGLLTEAVRQNPYSVILLDGIDQAHPDVAQVLIQVLDRGHLKDSHDRRVDFSNTLIFMTVDMGVDDPDRRVGIGSGAPEDPDGLRRRIERDARRKLSPNLLQRVDQLVVFSPLTRDAVRHIAEQLLQTWHKRLGTRNIRLELTDAAYDLIIDRGHSPRHGARPLRRVIEQQVIQAIADHGVQAAVHTIQHLSIDADNGQFKVKSEITTQ